MCTDTRNIQRYYLKLVVVIFKLKGFILQVGLSALKTPQCYSITARNYRCPVCQGPLNQLAMGLPYAHCAQSRLVCRITGQPLNEHNLPMMLPNGQVYGEKVIQIKLLVCSL